MATTHKWTAPTAAATLISSSNLNNLAAAGRKMSAAVGNDSAGSLYIYADFKLKLSASTANRCAGAHVKLYILYDLGDSAYTSGGSSLAPLVAAHVGNFVFDSGATAARVGVIPGVVLYPENFKVLVDNGTGKLFSCCTVLSYRKYYMQSST